MAIPLRQEYDPGLTRIRGWLALFCGFAFLCILAFLRSAMATVISGSGGGLVSLVIAVSLAGRLGRAADAQALELLPAF